MDNSIFAVRHGQTDWSRDGRAQGRSDQPLNETGRQQALRNARNIAAILEKSSISVSRVTFYTSPLDRCRQTARIICECLENSVIVEDERLIEMSFGTWEGLTDAEIKILDPVRRRACKNDRWHVGPPGGESYSELGNRLDPFLAQLRYPSVIISHLGVMRVLATRLSGQLREELVRYPFRSDAVYRFEGERVTAYRQP
jgi:probable phosphoglycerate mutase